MTNLKNVDFLDLLGTSYLFYFLDLLGMSYFFTFWICLVRLIFLLFGSAWYVLFFDVLDRLGTNDYIFL